MSRVIGLVAEDDTDVDTLKVIVNRVMERPTGFRKRVGNGCARIRHKAGIWLKQLGDEGCTAVIVLHDLDRNPANNALNAIDKLYRDLEKVCSGSGVVHFICIPVEEIEAWFWADEKVVKRVGRGEGKAHPNPEAISRPKEGLIRLSRGANKKPLYSTNENVKLAELLSLDICREKCPSFRGLYSFLQQIKSGTT
ncbi:DUF4276 family protein [Archangium lansingense]|uniref:DUF4276 family protein n=1 Tax=Archangium lansingense TaxID=2995310 RepID=A0ABT3ZVL9_9BACT|nr:DUF4276 family protein [Archangium lansinium]MCY1073452.1 DUF4276 family protein [Archangium lansinium]